MDQTATPLSGTLTPPPGVLFGGLLALLVTLFLTVSPYALMELGWNYGETGGSALEKIHPATLLAAFLVLLTAFMSSNPLVPIVNALAEHPRLVVYLATVILMMAHALLVVGLPFTVFIDSFIGPALVFLLLADVEETRRRRLAWLIHVFFLANALLGLVEVGTGFRLTPLYIEGETLEAEWRASALLGHPLSNAMLTGSYMVLLLSGGARDLPALLRPVAFLIAAAGMVAFGGRAATALLVLFVAWHGLRRAVEVLSGKPFNPWLALAGLIGLPLLALGVLALADVGFFDRFLTRFVDDEGSAGTRIAMFELFRHLSWPEIVLGPDAAYVHDMMRHYGLDYGIESFWVSTVLAHGLLASGVFFLGLLVFCLEVVRVRPGALAAMLYFFAVASASLSLSAKTHGFSVLVLLILVLLPPVRSGAVATFESRPTRHRRAGRPRLKVA